MATEHLREIEFLPSGPVRERFFGNIYEHSSKQGTHEEIQAMQSDLADGVGFGRGSQTSEGSPMHFKESRI
jgi:hypothetical protein